MSTGIVWDHFPSHMFGQGEVKRKEDEGGEDNRSGFREVTLPGTVGAEVNRVLDGVPPMSHLETPYLLV